MSDQHTPESSTLALTVDHDERAKQFQVRLNDAVAFLQYRSNRREIYFVHTEVPEVMRGHRIGDVLARTGFEYAKAHQLAVIVICPFVASYLARHPEYQPLVVDH